MQAKRFGGTRFEDVIRKAESPFLARKLGEGRVKVLKTGEGNILRRVVYETGNEEFFPRKDWERFQEKYYRIAIYEKFTQNLELKNMLIRTSAHIPNKYIRELRENLLLTSLPEIKIPHITKFAHAYKPLRFKDLLFLHSFVRMCAITAIDNRYPDVSNFAIAKALLTVFPNKRLADELLRKALADIRDDENGSESSADTEYAAVVSYVTEILHTNFFFGTNSSKYIVAILRWYLCDDDGLETIKEDVYKSLIEKMPKSESTLKTFKYPVTHIAFRVKSSSNMQNGGGSGKIVIASGPIERYPDIIRKYKFVRYNPKEVNNQEMSELFISKKFRPEDVIIDLESKWSSEERFESAYEKWEKKAVPKIIAFFKNKRGGESGGRFTLHDALIDNGSPYPPKDFKPIGTPLQLYDEHSYSSYRAIKYVGEFASNEDFITLSRWLEYVVYNGRAAKEKFYANIISVLNEVSNVSNE